MTKDLTAVGLSFLETAPVRRTFEVTIGQPIEAVFEAIAADPAGWTHWFPGFRPGGHYLSTTPTAAPGAVRVMRMGGQSITETVLAWDAPVRWAFCVTNARMPGIRALAENYALSSRAGGTVLNWTIAMSTAPALKPTSAFIGLGAKPMITRAGRNLERYLAG
jgi:uncharacterized protein YndB with AHSA1/START domain